MDKELTGHEIQPQLENLEVKSQKLRKALEKLDAILNGAFCCYVCKLETGHTDDCPFRILMSEEQSQKGERYGKKLECSNLEVVW